MNIDKEEFLEQLSSVKPGLSSRESLEQSSCFVFYDGEVITFNDEIACRMKTKLKITGAVTASALLSILDKIRDPKLEIAENAKGELEFAGQRKSWGLNRDAEVLLPVEKIREEDPKEEDWRPLPKSFQDIVDKVKTCVCQNEEFFALTCVHFHPKWIEACDSRQMLRWRVKFGIETPFLVRGTALAQVTGLAMRQMAVTESWVHFRNEKGLIFSCRKFVEDYPNLTEVMAVDGSPVTFPLGLGEAAERAAVFAAEQVSGINPMLSVYLRPGWMTIEGDGLVGWYKEHEKLSKYTGKKIRFIISPVLLRHIADNYNEAQITNVKLRASGDRWDYVSVLGEAKSRQERETEHAAAEAAQDVESESEEPKKKKKKVVEDDVPF